jgi:excisionase family DNA binding protein
MPTIPSEQFDSLAPTDAEARLAGESSRKLAAHKFGRRTSVRIQLLDGGDGEAVSVPTSALKMFQKVLLEMSRGNAVALIPTRAELTTQQAADLMNVSRPFVVKLLDEGKLPCRLVGKFRRVRFDDLMEYRRRDDEARARLADQLAADAQELGMGY